MYVYCDVGINASAVTSDAVLPFPKPPPPPPPPTFAFGQGLGGFVYGATSTSDAQGCQLVGSVG